MTSSEVCGTGAASGAAVIRPLLTVLWLLTVLLLLTIRWLLPMHRRLIQWLLTAIYGSLTLSQWLTAGVEPLTTHGADSLLTGDATHAARQHRRCRHAVIDARHVQQVVFSLELYINDTRMSHDDHHNLQQYKPHLNRYRILLEYRSVLWAFTHFSQSHTRAALHRHAELHCRGIQECSMSLYPFQPITHEGSTAQTRRAAL